MDIIWIKMYLIPLKPQFYQLLHEKGQPRVAEGKISNINFCKMVKLQERRECLSLTEDLRNTSNTHNYLLILHIL